MSIKIKRACFTLLILTATIMVSSVHAELIVLAAPTSTDEYYQSVEDEVFDFHIQFAKQIMTRE
jgi:hypothetical protein